MAGDRADLSTNVTQSPKRIDRRTFSDGRLGRCAPVQRVSNPNALRRSSLVAARVLLLGDAPDALNDLDQLFLPVAVVTCELD